MLKKKNTYQNKNNNPLPPKFINTENRLVVARGREWRWEKWVKGAKDTNFQL